MKKLTKTIRVLPAFLAGVAVLATMPVIAADTTATVVASRGTVSAVSDDNERTLGQGDSIFVNDRVVTGERSFAVLQFVDGAKVTVRPKSALVIEEYAYSGGDQDAATLSLVEGGLRVITGAMAKSRPENYKVKTPVALMGVRGTEFSVMLCGEEICAQDETENALAEN
jgi:hypothetical protein